MQLQLYLFTLTIIGRIKVQKYFDRLIAGLTIKFCYIEFDQVNETLYFFAGDVFVKCWQGNGPLLSLWHF